MALKIAVVQMSVTDDKLTNISKAVEYIASAAKGGADVVVLPEYFNCPHSNKAFLAFAESIPEGPTSKAIAASAKHNNVMVIAGSIPEKFGDDDHHNKSIKIRNTCAVFSSTGQHIGSYHKMHLFSIDTPKMKTNEADVFVPGSTTLVVEVKGFRLGIGICFDLRFPQLALHYAHHHNTDAIIYPGAFSMVTGPPHWILSARARALDAQQYVIACAPARTDSKKNSSGHVAFAHSVVVDPWGDVLADAGTDEGIIMAELTKAKVQMVRNQLPIIRGRRDDLYGLHWATGSKL